MGHTVIHAVLLAAALHLSAGFVPAEAATVTLRGHASVEDETVRLSDLFDGVGAAADKGVVAAPRIGAKMIIGTADLMTLAEANGLSWFPENRDQRIVVERAGSPVPVEVMVDGLERRLGPGRQVVLDTTNARLQVPLRQPTTVSVDQVTVDPRTGRLTAELSAPAGSNEAEHIKITGRVRTTVDVPVLRHAVLPGEMVRQQDLTYAAIPADQVSNTTISDPSKIVGKISRTMMRPDLPVRSGDVQLNAVIHKGDLVRVAVALPGLDVTTQGKALEDGAVGQAIRVLNTTSNITVQATVRGAGDVSITPGAAP